MENQPIEQSITQKGKLLFQKRYKTGHGNRVKAIKAIKSTLEKNNIAVTFSDYEFYLILDEALTNAMEHGNKWDAKKELEIELRKGKYLLYFYLKDEGQGFDVNKIPQLIKKKFKLSPRGRGLYIMSHYCRILWNSKGNQLCLCMKMKKK